MGKMGATKHVFSILVSLVSHNSYAPYVSRDFRFMRPHNVSSFWGFRPSCMSSPKAILKRHFAEQKFQLLSFWFNGTSHHTLLLFHGGSFHFFAWSTSWQVFPLILLILSLALIHIFVYVFLMLIEMCSCGSSSCCGEVRKQIAEEDSSSAGWTIRGMLLSN